MVVSLWDVVVMTPVRSFGELLQQALQETDLYRVTLVFDDQGLLSTLNDKNFSVVVLDMDLETDPGGLLRAVDEASSGAGLVVLRNKAGGVSDLPPGFRVNCLLADRFYLPDLLEALQAITSELDVSTMSVPDRSINQVPTPSTNHASGPTWMESPEQTARRLSTIPFQDPVQAAIILSNGQLWAYAGHLPQTAGEELAHILRYFWTPESNSDLARFIHLDATGKEYLLYATGLGGKAVLGLTLADETPFSTIRVQTREMVKQLAVL